MREIEFRGIVLGDRDCETYESETIHAGEFVYGQIVFNAEETYIVGELFEGTDEYIAVEYWIPVRPKTVGQFTGLLDKNGTKIFEGDIVDFTTFDYNDSDTQWRGVVVFSCGSWMIWKYFECEFYGGDGGFGLDWVCSQDDEIEVIGNIHDNPELLED